MNNRNPHNHNKQRQNERPFAHILKRALPHQEDRNIDTAQHMYAIPEYRITIWLGQKRTDYQMQS